MSSRLQAERFTAVIGQEKIRIFRKFVRYLLLILDFKPFIEININLEEEKKEKKNELITFTTVSKVIYFMLQFQFFLLVKFAVINYISVIESSILNIIEQIIIIIL